MNFSFRIPTEFISFFSYKCKLNSEPRDFLIQDGRHVIVKNPWIHDSTTHDKRTGSLVWLCVVRDISKGKCNRWRQGWFSIYLYFLSYVNLYKLEYNLYMYVLFEPWRPIDPVLIPGFCGTKRTGGTHPQDRMLVYRWILPLAMLSTPLTRMGEARAKTTDVTEPRTTDLSIHSQTL